MSSRFLVDVIIPSYRRPASLQQALTSVEELRKQAGDLIDLQIQVIDESQGSGNGPAFARNRAVAQGKGDYLALLDDDDRWLPGRLIPALKILKARPEIALVSGDARLASGGRFLSRSSPDQSGDHNHRALALDCFVCCSTVTLRRHDWEELGGMDEGMQRAEDYDLWLRMTQRDRAVHVLKEPLVDLNDQNEERLSASIGAMAEATLVALERSAKVPSSDPRFRDRCGRLRAEQSLALRKEGWPAAARTMAWKAIGEAPKARIAWSAALRSLLPRIAPSSPE